MCSQGSVHLPPWAGIGCSVLSVWDEPVVSGTSKGVRTMVKYLNKKGAEKIMTKWVKWE